MIYLYGLCNIPVAQVSAQIQNCDGLQGPLRLAAIAGWTLVYSDHDDQEIIPRRRLLLRHTQILEGLLQLGAVLPARFGLVAATLEQVHDLIVARATLIGTEFDKIAGAVEIGVRISFAREAALTAALDADPTLKAAHRDLMQKGRDAHFALAAFGGRLAERVDRRRGLAQKQLLDAFRPLARDHVLRAPEDDTEVLRAEFLLDAARQEAFQTTVQDAAQTLDFAPESEPQIQIIGPVPMYNFVRLNLSFDQEEAVA